MRLRAVLMIGLSFGSAYSLFGDEYLVTVNTSSIFGSTGSLDFQFNPGPLITQPANLQILGFTSGGSLVDCAANIQGFCQTGDVTGTLPGTLTFDNGTGFNDYFDNFTYGNTLSFEVNLNGPAVSSPDGTSTSGSAFAFSMFSDADGTVPALTTDTTYGVAVGVDLNLDGSTTVTNNSPQASVVPVAAALPEPGAVLEGSLSTLLVVGWLLRKRKSLSRP